MVALTRRACARRWGACSRSPMHGSLSSRRRRPTQRTVGPSDSQGETPNSFSMSAIIGCVKPALRMHRIEPNASWSLWPPSWDLLICAKDLFIAAMVDGSAWRRKAGKPLGQS